MPVRMRGNTKKTQKNIIDAATKMILRSAIEIESVAKRSMHGGGLPHMPSAPGDPPHVDTGRLRSSITHEVEYNNREIEGRVGTNVEYALELEIGSSRIAARPFLRPAFNAVIG